MAMEINRMRLLLLLLLLPHVADSGALLLLLLPQIAESDFADSDLSFVSVNFLLGLAVSASENKGLAVPA